MEPSTLTDVDEQSDKRAPAAGERAVEYVVLDPVLRQAEPRRFMALFEGFVAEYTRNFAGDEAESSEAWLARINGEPLPQPLMRIVVATERVDGGERVFGGAAFEYYRNSKCVLVTYLFVSDQNRRRGHARELLGRVGSACAALGPICALLAESEWPELLPQHENCLLKYARQRLGFFSRIGARMLNIDYEQPALGPGKDPVTHLRLLVLPSAQATKSESPDDALARAVGDFLVEFYAALEGAADGKGRTALDRQRNQLAERRPLTSPLPPLPRLYLDDAALCFHFVEPLEGASGDGVSLQAIKERNCRVLHSMETDLLSRAYRVPRLFRTVCLTLPARPDIDAGVVVTIRFPQRLTFQSENRDEERQWPLRSRRVRAYLAASFFFDVRLVVWHLTLKVSPDAAAEDEHSWLDEFDLIALLKLADDGADQEFVRVPAEGEDTSPDIAKRITFGLADEKPALHLMSLLQAVAAHANAGCDDAPVPKSPKWPWAVTVQLLGWKISNDPERRKALCGVVTNILDFEAINDAEVNDTLTPVVKVEGERLYMNRATLVKVAKNDRTARTVGGAIGASPYLIIPHATVLCDEWLMRQAEEKALSVGAESKPGKLATALKKMENMMRRLWIPNPFFYPTEQTLFNQGLVESGTTARRAKAEELLLELKTQLHLANQAQRARFEAIIAGLLGMISVMSLDALIVYFASKVAPLLGVASTADFTLVAHCVTVVVASLTGFFIGKSKWHSSLDA